MEKRMKTTLVVALISLFASALFAQERTDSVSAGAEPDTLKYSVNLGEVEVKASNVTHKADRDIYVVTPEMKKGIHNAGELLSRVNGVVYNPMTREINYLGSKNVVILLDSVPKTEDYIKKLSPNRFDRIDVITYPTGEYVGADVLINFHTRPSYQGYESNLQADFWVSPDSRLGRDRWLKRGQGYGDFTFTKDKWNLVVSLQDMRSSSASNTDYKRIYPLAGLQESTLTHSLKYPSNTYRRNELTGYVAVDYEIDKRQSVSVQWNTGTNDSHNEEFQRLLVENLNDDSHQLVDYSSRGHMHG